MPKLPGAQVRAYFKLTPVMCKTFQHFSLLLLVTFRSFIFGIATAVVCDVSLALVRPYRNRSCVAVANGCQCVLFVCLYEVYITIRQDLQQVYLNTCFLLVLLLQTVNCVGSPV